MAIHVPSLPLDIVEHIQSLMSYRDATRSAAVCSRLYWSWYMRKHIDIDECSFSDPFECGRVGMRILNRYRNKDLKLEKFTIRIGQVAEAFFYSRDLIVAAAKMGVVEMTIIPTDNIHPFRIPTAIFESDDIAKLSVVGGILCIGEEIPVICQSLKFLSLLPARYLNLGNDLMNHIVMRCPNLETLVCRGHLLRYDCERLGGRLHNLESLIVERLTYQDQLWFTLFHRSLPCLRSLTLRNLFNIRNLLIHNPTVERFTVDDILRPASAILSLPRLSVFHFRGVASSSFTFHSSLYGVVSNINIVYRRHVPDWLAGAQGLLRGLDYSTIFLTMRFLDREVVQLDEANRYIEPNQYMEPITVELLDIRTAVHDPSLVESLLNILDPHVFRYDHV